MIRAKTTATTPPMRKAKKNGNPNTHKKRVVIAPNPKKAACPKLTCPAYPARIFQLWAKQIYKKIRIMILMRSFLFVNNGTKVRKRAIPKLRKRTFLFPDNLSSSAYALAKQSLRPKF
jgi:hypothetical protein